MKKFLLMNINQDLAMLVAAIWLIAILFPGMLAVEAFKDQIETALQSYGLLKIMVTMSLYTIITAWPLLRAFPSK